MSIQVLVEGDFAEYAVLPEDFGTLKGGMNKDLSVAVKFMNNSKEAVSSLGYVVSVDGVAGSEQSVDVSPAVALLTKCMSAMYASRSSQQRSVATVHE